MANNRDPDEMAHYEPSHQDLYCLHRCPFWSARLKGLSELTFWNRKTLTRLQADLRCGSLYGVCVLPSKLGS